MKKPDQLSTICFKLSQAALTKNYTLNFTPQELQYLLEMMDDICNQEEQQP